jgi:hypothetical protein
MPDTLLRFIPTQPAFVPSAQSRAAAREKLEALLPHADEVTALVEARVQFFDPGANLEAVRCPGCRAELASHWWQEAMDAADASRFEALAVTAPCCGTPTNLNELHYASAAGFARFLLEARNPRVEDLGAEAVRELEAILGCQLRRIVARY